MKAYEPGYSFVNGYKWILLHGEDHLHFTDNPLIINNLKKKQNRVVIGYIRNYGYTSVTPKPLRFFH